MILKKSEFKPIHIPDLVRDATDFHIKIWSESDVFTPQLKCTYSSQQKRDRENQLNAFLKKLKAQVQSVATSRNFPAAFRHIFKTALDFNKDQLDLLLSPANKEATQRFISKARSFDPSLPANNIIQAARNVWIMTGLQTMLGLPVQLTPAIFGYSLLYPYTDNFLDDATIAAEAKYVFSSRLALRLQGESLEPSSVYEQNVFRLVTMIESQYKRNDFPQVFDSLLAIHDAQTNSLNLCDPGNNLSESEILRISIEKGGTSVLADGFLVSGILSEAQAYFLFGYGAYLQLLDDLQDVQEDSDAQIKTLFSRAGQDASLDRPACRTYHFGANVMRYYRCFNGENLDALIGIMNRSMTLLLIEAVGTSGTFFSKSFLQELEKYSPFHFSFLTKNHHSISPYRILMQKAFDNYTAAQN